jgi:hypothetical protein
MIIFGRVSALKWTDIDRQGLNPQTPKELMWENDPD